MRSWAKSAFYFYLFAVTFLITNNVPIVNKIPTGKRIYALVTNAEIKYTTNEINATVIA